ncbi:unnamed protein product [Ectocarpus sp. CCAP 1310/34]|nr:unnamed protein product [Ectocarpus sp. CCAP 1310/34]
MAGAAVLTTHSRGGDLEPTFGEDSTFQK